MKKFIKYYAVITTALLSNLIGCNENHEVIVTVKNPIEMNRESETIELNAHDFQALIQQYGYEKLAIINKKTGNLLVNQWIDLNGDGTQDQWLFQTDIHSMGQQEFIVRPLKEGESQPQSSKMTYSRFVPERTDDYAWENDRIAFRTFGPDAQKRIENNQPGGTLTSGIDAWLKRVDYPIINKWYKNNEEQQGSYHIDTGEGYDPYHVGPSRGVGGIGFWTADSLYTSKNFSSYKKITEGPIRTVFILEYQPWDVNGVSISEEKLISLDLGSNMCHFQSTFKSDAKLPPVAIGISLHDKSGKTYLSNKDGVYSYWEEIDKDMLGLGIVLPKEQLNDAFERKVEHKDASHLLVLATPNEAKVNYYAGYGWERSKQFSSDKEWNQYLEQFAKKVQKPLQVHLAL
ncbi:DUF4861 domain-containing protein [Flammeovirga sp. SJP92]|uniref:DUF4861 domain-containing protein n=1 Tax=Flammeovirga sp. SJP92 TaxID=1775430 RepID=UPI0007872441|nr:DUF4861 domain-containing protein [Flammeovirga sp. SJP92]KXX71603.1 hypothetical protein AVL50_04845 [Flammeovirga sp. SJP92]